MLFRLTAQHLGWTKAETLTHTMRQVANALDSRDPSSPHRGNMSLGSIGQLERFFKSMGAKE